MSEMNIKRYLDENGLIKIWPAKQNAKKIMLDYLAESFAYDTNYTEKEVNAVIQSRHTFNDYFLLRRSLIDCGLLCRLPDGSKYWRPKKTAEETPTNH